MKATIKDRLATVTAVIALLAVWEAWVRIGKVPQSMFSSPTQIVKATIDAWPTLWPATQVTAFEGFVGFAFAILCGVLIGIAFYCFRTLNAALYPLLYAAQTMPLITIAPLFLIWFGFEISGKIVITAFWGLFPIAVQTIRGLKAVPQFYTDVALTCGATPTWTLWHVKLRVAARQIFGGVRISAAYIFATATTAEYLGARKGLGIWLQAAYNSFRTPLIFSATIVIVLLTVLLMLIVNVCERVLLGPVDEDFDPDECARAILAPFAEGSWPRSGLRGEMPRALIKPGRFAPLSRLRRQLPSGRGTKPQTVHRHGSWRWTKNPR